MGPYSGKETSLGNLLNRRLTTVYDCLQCKATMASTTGKPKKCIRCGSGEAYLKERGTI